MQISVHYREEDQYLIDRIERKARRERKSNSAVIMSIFESYFEEDKRVGRILQDMNVLSGNQLEEGLQVQQSDDADQRLGQILLDKGYVREVDLDKALRLQGSFD